MATVLVAEDDAVTRQLLTALLQTKGHQTLPAGDGRMALELVRTKKPDLAILDIGIPHVEGLKVCERVRAGTDTANLPVIILTSRLEPSVRYEGFLAGADDFLSKPFDPVELLLRVDAILRRTARASAPDKLLIAGPYALDLARFVFRAPGGEVLLTKAEMAIMACLFRRSGDVVSVDDLLREALDYPRGVGNPDTVHTHVRKIRHKIEPDAANPRILETVARLGYRLGIVQEAGPIAG